MVLDGADAVPVEVEAIIRLRSPNVLRHASAVKDGPGRSVDGILKQLVCAHCAEASLVMIIPVDHFRAILLTSKPKLPHGAVDKGIGSLLGYLDFFRCGAFLGFDGGVHMLPRQLVKVPCASIQDDGIRLGVVGEEFEVPVKVLDVKALDVNECYHQAATVEL